ncbi:MAG TPA: PSD1 and planctomycete cytochrome C domain-containing protein [Blastocatellia bacterium]|nr:PSD1 and planctomycete cytochrome C domain-containing protein [Blastocatellia bacterium]
MRRNRWIKLICIFSCLSVWAGYSSRAAERSFEQDDEQWLARQAVAVLQTRCVVCHGKDKESGLDARTREGLLKGGSRGPAIKPGDADDSPLYRFIAGEEKPRMPMGEELSEYQVGLVKQWIDKGAIWPGDHDVAVATVDLAAIKPITDEQRDYWAFRKPSRPQVPTLKNQSWVRTPIDAFVLAKLEEKGLKPSPGADKRALIRRVTFDLTGLPPTPAEIDAFLADRAPDAYHKVVKRLLASPRYGERWAQHWLDVVRFGETNGFELDAEREQSWRYRDYVVKSFNDDKPYDQFIIEQVAGDELDPNSFEMRVATGFLRAGPQHVVAGNQDLAVNRQEWLTEVMFGVGNGMLGLTVGCARCHDHKFDPIPQADFYRLQAFFAASDNYDFKRPTKEQSQAYEAAVTAHKEKLKPILDQIAAIEKPYKEKLKTAKRAKLEPQFAKALTKEDKLRSDEEKRLAKEAQGMLEVKWDELIASLSPEDREKRAALRRQMHGIELYAPDPLPKALAVADKLNPTPLMNILKGGDPHRLGDEVRPRFPGVMTPKDAPPEAEIEPVKIGEFKSTGRRLALARWLARPDNPLTARVIMNRLWHYHFGRGIVATPNDFGRNGQQPTHTELLDWLAVEFMNPSWNAGDEKTRRTGDESNPQSVIRNPQSSGWSLKRMTELMVLSNVYQQSSAIDDTKEKIDPDNKLLWRMNRQRLDAEAIRDAVLAVNGNLTEQLGGPSIKVPLEPEVYDTIFTEYEPDNLWPIHPDPRQHTRRSLYLIRKRNVRLPLLVAFDAPDLMGVCGARQVSVHSLQSLTLMNSEFMLKQSRALAERLFKEVGGDERQKSERMISRLYELALARKPRLDELRVTQNFLKGQAAVIRERAARGETVAKLNGLPKNVDEATAAAWVDLCLATMNLNEFVYVK